MPFDPKKARNAGKKTNRVLQKKRGVYVQAKNGIIV